MPGASNLAVFMFRHAFSISGILKVAAHNFMKSRARDGLAAKGLFLIIKGFLKYFRMKFVIQKVNDVSMTPCHHYQVRDT